MKDFLGWRLLIWFVISPVAALLLGLSYVPTFFLGMALGLVGVVWQMHHIVKQERT